MRAVVVYESMFGHTRVIAERVGAGLRGLIDDVVVVPVARAASTSPEKADLVVVGGPTHVHSLSSRRTRLAAVADPEKYGAGAPPEPGAGGIGLREWFQTLPKGAGRAGAFDTRAGGSALVTGRASRGIAKRLASRGFSLVGGPQSFVVGPESVLRPGEQDRAEQWGRSLARTVVGDAVGERRGPGRG